MAERVRVLRALMGKTPAGAGLGLMTSSGRSDYVYTHTFSRDTARNKENSSFVAAYGVSSVGKVC